MSDLRRMLLRGERKIGVWGTGYIGFSTMANFAAQGVTCVGTDVSESVVKAINDGRMPVPNLEYWLGFDTKYLVQSGMLRATVEWRELLNPEFAVHMIAVPTERGDRPWDGALSDVVSKIAKQETDGPPLVIVESTLTPKKTDSLIIRTLEENDRRVGTDSCLSRTDKPRRAEWSSGGMRSRGSEQPVFNRCSCAE